MNENTEHFESEEPTSNVVLKAVKQVSDLLKQGNGVVSTRRVKEVFSSEPEFLNFEQGGLDGLISQLKVVDWENYPQNTTRFHHQGRSFYSQEKYAEEQKAQQSESPDLCLTLSPGALQPQPQLREYTQAEQRIVESVCDALRTIYGTEYGPEADYVFDVHNNRGGDQYENVDVLALDWRSDSHVELIAVEAKTSFNVQVVHQATHYMRFADRSWIAVKIDGELQKASSELRGENPSLFDYVLKLGIGILACKRRRGNNARYEVLPIHWPSTSKWDPFERRRFIERYQEQLQSAKALPPIQPIPFPSLI
jgi:hypothetical protein